MGFSCIIGGSSAGGIRFIHGNDRVLEERGDIENRLTYTGQMYDGKSGQYNLRAKFYNLGTVKK